MKAAKSNSLHFLVQEVSALLNQVAGIELGPRQAHMVEARLARRMTELHIDDPTSYLEYIRENIREELPMLTSLLTTHHTFFFREFFHFEFLETKALPELVQVMRREGRKTLRVWSAACSRGQEAYSLSMCLFHYFRRFAPDLSFEILGSDIDSESVAYARNGVYRWEEVKEIPLAYMASHWSRGTGEISSFVKARQSIKTQCKFQELNLFDAGAILAGRSFDLIVCRNVFIYFSQPQISVVMDSLLKLLHSDGYLFLGISESMNGMRLPIDHLGQSVYAKPKAKLRAVPTVTPSVQPESQKATEADIKPTLAALPPASPASKVRVLCVDDSPVILSLLKRILAPEFGFEVVDTASNGLEAARKLATTRVDLVTLDIHMPEQNGVEYLKQNLGPNHPPVVMVSSVSRENADLALKALELGAKDYVEKPSLGDLTTRGNQIRAKLRCAAEPGTRVAAPSTQLEREFRSRETIVDVERKLRVILAGPGDMSHVNSVLGELKMPQPPTVVLFQGVESLVPKLGEKISAQGWKVASPAGKLPNALEPGHVYVGDFGAWLEDLRKNHGTRRTSLLVFGALSREHLHSLRDWSSAQMVLEEVASNVSAAKVELVGIHAHVVPVTSFSYLSDSWLSKDPDKGGSK